MAATRLPPTPASAEILRMVQTVATRFAPRSVAVFGSFARGEAGPNSDVDLLVVVDHAPDRRALAVQIRLALNPRTLPLDVLVVTPQQLTTSGAVPGTTLYTALHEGVVLYEGHPHAA